MQTTPHSNTPTNSAPRFSIAENVARKTMSTREIAELTGKAHFHVKRDVLALLKELGEDASSFGCIYLDPLNREQTEYLLDQHQLAQWVADLGLHGLYHQLHTHAAPRIALSWVNRPSQVFFMGSSPAR